ncbi:MAG: hypothetical protein GY757_47500 [bacterium]|nr:hypothetical protein [bacterium]
MLLHTTTKWRDLSSILPEMGGKRKGEKQLAVGSWQLAVGSWQKEKNKREKLRRAP